MSASLNMPVAEMLPATAQPSTPEALPKFLTEALKMAECGIPVSFLPAGQKGSNTPGWQDSATNNLEELKRRAGDGDRRNYACVAKAAPEGFLFLDDDGGVRAEFEKLYGPLPRTLKAQSCNGSFHYYFRHSPRSLAYQQSVGKAYIEEPKPDGKGELWSLRMNNAYIVGPGSVVPNKQGIDSEYKIVYDAPIIEIPDELLAFLSSRCSTKKTPPSVNGAKIPHGSHDTELTRIAGKLRVAGMEEETMAAALIEICEKRCVDYGDDYREMCEKIAHSICRHAPGKDESVYVGSSLAGTTANDTSALQTRTADKIRTKKIKWLWDQRIPFGKLSVLAGNPDQGKSLVTMYMVSQLTAGRTLYGSTVAMEACEVLVLAGEDEPADTIVPRLQAGDADLSKVHLLDSVVIKDGKGQTTNEREAQLDTDIQALEKMLNDHPKIRLVIVDPLSNYLGRANMNREQEVRQVLVPLKGLAARTGVAIVAVMHLNKSTDASAIHRIGGAVAFTGVARAVWLFTEDPQDPTKHLMLRVKGNIAKRVGGLSYRIQAKPVIVEGSPETQPYVEWIGQTEQVASDVLIGGAPVGRPNEKIKTATEWLKDFLKDGFQTAADVEKFGRRSGHTWATLRRTKDEIKATAVQRDRKWWWALPGDEVQQEEVEL